MKYRLLKDLPGYPAGSIFVSPFNKYGHKYIEALLNNFIYDPDWFEPIKEAEKRYYHIKMYPSKNYAEDSVFDYVNSYTEAQAEAVSEAIKALLEYIHADNYNLTDEGEAAHIREVLYKARKAVQGEA